MNIREIADALLKMKGKMASSLMTRQREKEEREDAIFSFLFVS